MAERLGYRGYVTSRGFGGYAIPVPVQSLVLRDYCRRLGLTYVLPVNENIFPHSYLVLEGLIRDLSGYEGVLMCSMHMLPKRLERRQAVCESIIGQGAQLHLVLEEQVIRDDRDIAALEELLAFYHLAEEARPQALLDAGLPGEPAGE